MITCTHWKHIGLDHGGYCNLHKLTCSHGVCNNCQDFEQASKIKLALRRARIGDKVAAVTSVVGIKPCGGCKKRQAWLNGEANKFPDSPENRATVAKSED